MRETVTLTENGNAVIMCQKADPLFLHKVDELFCESSADAFVLGQHPVLSTGFLQTNDFLCMCPPNGTLAVSGKCFQKVGNPDMLLGWATSADYLYRLKEAGFICKPAFSVKAPSFELLPEETTCVWLDGLMLDYKHGNKKQRHNVHDKLINALKRYDITIGNYSRKTLVKKYPRVIFTMLKYNTEIHGKRDESFDFFRQAYLRGSFFCPDVISEPLVSVIIRTHRRPEVLRKTLDLLRLQTYRNYEIVLIEDGEPTAQKMIETDFQDLPLRYYSTGASIGRSAAANLGFSLAKGKYLNLLDDDDYLYPEHIETAVSVAEEKKVDIVFMQDLSLSIEKTSDIPYEYKVNEAHFMNFPRIDPFTMSHFCATPDNGVFFRKTVLDYAIGMREDLDANEDWSLWLRMLTRASYSVVHFATCCFVVPYNEKEKKERIEKYSVYNGLQIKDDLLEYQTSGEQICAYYEGVQNDFEALQASGLLEKYLLDELSFWKVIQPDEYLKYAYEFKEKAENRKEGVYTAEDFVRYYLGMLALKQKEIAKSE